MFFLLYIFYLCCLSNSPRRGEVFDLSYKPESGLYSLCLVDSFFFFLICYLLLNSGSILPGYAKYLHFYLSDLPSSCLVICGRSTYLADGKSHFLQDIFLRQAFTRVILPVFILVPSLANTLS